VVRLPLRPRFDPDGNHRLAQVQMFVEAVAAKLHAELVFILRAKAAVAAVTGRDFPMLGVFLSVNFGMDFKHCDLSDLKNGQAACPAGRRKRNDLLTMPPNELRDFTQGSRQKYPGGSWRIRRMGLQNI
jgi:hypothetical protein